ncbi:MAG TPA: lysylphosphatidylglycerol synthase transmembrane domain-containing protein, partial [Methylomirabilota bacterium]|nr:lysylphosphatidylglycerol synthase transmembrane domain-containing protein [Methylomirabilota bacterium]
VANRHGLSRAGLAASRAVESVIDGVTFLLVLLLAIALSDVAFAAPALLWGMAVAAVFGLAATMLLSRALPSQLPGWRILRAVPGRLRRVVDDALPRLRDGLETMRNPRHLGEAVALNVASWGVQAVMFVMLGLAFDLDLSPGAYIGITIAANAVTVLPITFENIGTYEVLVLEVLSLAGVPRDDALAYAVASHAITNAWVIALGIAAMWAMRLRPREIFGIRGQGG